MNSSNNLSATCQRKSCSEVTSAKHMPVRSLGLSDRKTDNVLMRREFLQLLLSGIGCVSLSIILPKKAYADDDGGGDDGGGDDGGSDDGGGDDGGDDGGGDDSGDDAKDNEGDYTSNDSDQDDALSARQSGNALPAGELIAMLKKKLRGEIIDIRLVNQTPTAYDVKMMNVDGRIGIVRVAAKTFKIIRVTGF